MHWTLDDEIHATDADALAQQQLTVGESASVPRLMPIIVMYIPADGGPFGGTTKLMAELSYVRA
jgi:hypothetical protein